MASNCDDSCGNGFFSRLYCPPFRTDNRHYTPEPQQCPPRNGGPFTALWAGLLTAAGIVLLLITVARPAPAATLTIDADAQYRFAQNRFDAGRFESAIDEFERFRFFFPSDRRAPTALWRIAQACYRLGRLPQTVDYVSRLIGSGKVSDPQRLLKAQLLISRCLVGMGQRQAAIEHLTRLADAASNPSVADELNYQLGWLYIDAGQWARAESQFARIRPDHSRDYRLTALQRGMDARRRSPLKRPAVAGTLAIIPGAGYWYCERPRDALVSLGVNAAFFLGAWEAYDNDLNTLGTLLGIVGAGFYAGSIYGSVASAHKINRDDQQRFRDDLQQRFRVGLLTRRDAIGLQFSLVFK
jgi:tetratricopeptide (TPR) repeat protein